VRADSFDPARYKAEQRRGWDAAAHGWEAWWETFERAAQRVSDRLVELAEIGPGQRVLDIATGIGEPAVTAALRVGRRGQVTAVDQAPQMVALARRRAAALGLPNVEFREMDAEALELPERAFDAVLCRWGLMFLPAVETALRSIRDLLVPGGRLAAAVWAPAEQVPLIGLATEVLRDELRAPPLVEGTPHPFRLGDRAELERTLARAGFTDVRSEPLTVTFEFASAEAYARFIREVGASIPALEDLPAERRYEIWQAVASAVHLYASPEGAVRMPNEAICVVGRRPEEPRVARCPFCGGTETSLESAFGSTLGFAQYWCRTCRTPFEYLKWEENVSR
jgi:ubiquinone/menaquinone biosynthesis C-methylase UbiE